MASALWLSDDPIRWRAHLDNADATTNARCAKAATKSNADSVVADAHVRYVALRGCFPQQTALSLEEVKVNFTSVFQPLSHRGGATLTPSTLYSNAAKQPHLAIVAPRCFGIGK